MKERICYVVGAGENFGLDFQPATGDFVIAADAGLRYLEKQGIRADLVIGDFDTLKYIPGHSKTIALSAEKDDTDTLAAVREGIMAGYTSFHIYCGTGGRIDHTMANLQVIAYLSANNMCGFLFDNGTVITAMTNGSLCFGKIPCGYVSVFSCSEKAEGVTLCGLKYELNNATLTNTFPIGASNEFIGRESSISVSSGTLLIVFPREAKERIISRTSGLVTEKDLDDFTSFLHSRINRRVLDIVRSGSRAILASAAPELYACPFAAKAGISVISASRPHEAENRGERKLADVIRQGAVFDRNTVVITDHHDDLPLLKANKEGLNYIVKPSRKSLGILLREGIRFTLLD